MIAALKDFTLSFSFPHLMLTQRRPLITAKSNKLYICDGWERERAFMLCLHFSFECKCAFWRSQQLCWRVAFEKQRVKCLEEKSHSRRGKKEKSEKWKGSFNAAILWRLILKLLFLEWTIRIRETARNTHWRLVRKNGKIWLRKPESCSEKNRSPILVFLIRTS